MNAALPAGVRNRIRASNDIKNAKNAQGLLHYGAGRRKSHACAPPRRR